MHNGGQLQIQRYYKLLTLTGYKILTAEENQAHGDGRNQQNIGTNANISGVVAQNIGENAQVGGKGTQFGGKRETSKF